MEKISKVIAITLDKSYDGNGGNCKVVGFFANNFYIDDPDKIQSVFHTSSTIFSNKIYESGPDIRINDLIEIIPSGEINFETELNKNIFIYIKQVNKTGAPVIDIPSEYIAEGHLDLENISTFCNSRNIIPESFTRIYLCDNNEIFGPFKYEKGNILPVKGKEANAFEYHIEELVEEDDLLTHLYLIKEPRVKIRTVDCSTSAQLVEFLKDRISIDRADLNLILKVGQQISLINNKQSDLDLVRLKRAERYLNQLKLSFEQLQELGENEGWGEVVRNSIDSHKEEFEKFALAGLQDRLNTIESELEYKNKEWVLVSQFLGEEQQKLEDLKGQIHIIESKKDEIITTLKIMANIQPQVFSTTSSNKYEEVSNPVEFISHIYGSAEYTDLYDFYEHLNDEYNFRIPNKSRYEDGLILLKECQFLLSKNTEFVLNLLAHIGNSKIAIQHAEADWLKFNIWKENGLLSVIKKANTDEIHHYFYILQDFNIASFECYGKPIIDISNKIRSTIDGVNNFPSNLTIILIRTDEEIDGFGFDLNPSTFKNWKCLPNLDSINLVQFPSKELIDLENIKFNKAPEDYSNQYF